MPYSVILSEAEVAALRAIAKAYNLTIERGKFAGDGNIRQLLQAISEKQIALEPGNNFAYWRAINRKVKRDE